MGSAAENEVTPVDDGAIGENSSEPVSPPRRARRWRTRRLVVVGGIGAFLLFVMLGTVIHFLTKEQGIAVDPATSSFGQVEQMPFQAALAHLVQSGDDTIRLYDFSPTSQQLETLASIERLRILRVDNGELTTQSGDVLASMPHLEQLHFRGVSLDDDTLDAIAKSRTIWLLNISGAKLSHEAIGRLANMPELRQLRLAIENGGNHYAEAVAKIKTLRALHLIGIGINNDGLKSIAGLPNLESIYIDDSNVNEDGWAWLFENKTHLHIHIDQKHHDRDPQKH